jgi:hypothetical protein
MPHIQNTPRGRLLVDGPDGEILAFCLRVRSPILLFAGTKFDQQVIREITSLVV